MILSVTALALSLIALGVQIYRYLREDRPYRSEDKKDIIFYSPHDPQVGDLFVADGRVFEYNGEYWKFKRPYLSYETKDSNQAVD